MSDIRFSIIVPVYNVEKYLHRCVDSLLNQTFQNFEIILVDDGSPDGCPAICNEYAEREGRVSTIHKENGGLSSARNTALDSPLKGDYVLFVDSDDELEQYALELCAKVIERESPDVVLYDCNMIYQGDAVEGRYSRIEEANYKIFEGKEILQQFLLRAASAMRHYSVCCGVYKKTLLDDLRFRMGVIHEDMDFKYKILQRSQRAVFSDEKLYIYYVSENTTTTSGVRKKNFDLITANNIIFELTQREDYGTIRELGAMQKARTSFSLLSKIAFYGIDDDQLSKKKLVDDLRNDLRKDIFLLLRSPIGIARKMVACGFYLNYGMTEKIIHLIQKNNKITKQLIRQPR